MPTSLQVNLTIADIIGYVIAGAVNGAVLMPFAYGSMLSVALGGILAFAVTTVAMRFLSNGWKNSNQELWKVEWVNLFIMGILNGVAFYFIRDNLGYGTGYTVLAGALSFYLISIIHSVAGAASGGVIKIGGSPTAPASSSA